jgi:cleavage and polyadenylation specificity factor subunit 3
MWSLKLNHLGSAKGHHTHDIPKDKHPSINARTPEERLERLFWFLEAQFGVENVSPVADPKLPPLPKKNGKATAALKDEGDASDASMDLSDDENDETHLEERRKAELDRLHKIGVPVPGVSIKVDRMTATVWLEDLEVDSNHKVFADRVKAVVDRACETIAPLWGK